MVLLRPNFYNRELTADAKTLTERRFGNALEVSAGDGQPYRTLLADELAGEILGNEVWDLTPALGDTRTYRLRFRAQNTTPATVTVLPVLNVSGVVDPQTVPHPSFPILAYTAAIALVAFLALRGNRLERPAALLGAVGCAVPVPLLARVAGLFWAGTWVPSEVTRSRITAGPGAVGSSGMLEGLRFDPLGSPHDVAGLLVARVAFAVVVCLAALAWWRSRRRVVVPSLGTGAVWVLAACLAVSAVALDVRWQALMSAAVRLSGARRPGLPVDRRELPAQDGAVPAGGPTGRPRAAVAGRTWL